VFLGHPQGVIIVGALQIDEVRDVPLNVEEVELVTWHTQFRADRFDTSKIIDMFCNRFRVVAGGARLIFSAQNT
jgi:hypothetical protein